MSLHPQTRSTRLGFLLTDSPQLPAPSREVEFASAIRRMTLIAKRRLAVRVKDSKRVRKEEDERTASILAAMDSGKPEAEGCPASLGGGAASASAAGASAAAAFADAAAAAASSLTLGAFQRGPGPWRDRTIRPSRRGRRAAVHGGALKARVRAVR